MSCNHPAGLLKFHRSGEDPRTHETQHAFPDVARCIRDMVEQKISVNDFRCVWQQTCAIFRVCTCIWDYCTYLSRMECFTSIDKSHQFDLLRTFGRICAPFPVGPQRQELKPNLGHEFLLTKKRFDISSRFA